MLRRRCFLSAAALPLAGAAHATLEPPAGPPVLTLSGRIGLTNRPGAAAFDQAMLERLPQTTVQTLTPWYPQSRRFTGPLLRDLLAAVGAQGRQLRLLALNDYQVEIPLEDAQRFDVVVTRLLDGKPMTVREKGPLFIMYPFDDVPALRNSVYYSRCVWQLQRIEVQ